MDRKKVYDELFVNMMKAQADVDGYIAYIKDKRDGQEYTVEIKPVERK